MGIEVVERDVRESLPLFRDLLNRNRREPVGIERFEWLYLRNPKGLARSWVVRDEKTEQLVAFTSVLPRLVSVNGEIVTCWNCCDFSVDPKYRSLGVATKLRRKAKECIDEGKMRALYAHPNAKMELIHQRVGHHSIGKMQRYAKVLHWDPQVRKHVRWDALAKPITVFLDCFSRSLDSIFSGSKNGFSMERLGKAPFGEEFDRLFQEATRWYRIIGDRSASYLTWRYVENPLYECERIVIRRNGKLVGYIIFSLQDNIAVFKDILCVPEDGIIKAAGRYWIEELRRRGIYTISAVLMDHNPMIPTLRKLGFKSRPGESSVFGYVREDDNIQPIWLDGGNWYMTAGDRDV